LSINYRKMKEGFVEEESIKKINEKLSQNKEALTTKDIKISIDISAKTNWDANLTLYLDNIPFRFIGKGEQNSVKMKLALQSKMDSSNIIMIEEPETNLSFTNMNKLVNNISESCSGKQLFISTHSSFIMNKTGVDKVIFLHNGNSISMKDINKDTQNYFMKLPGYDTLRMIIASKTILVEGPSDELVIQKAYFNEHKKLPIEDGIDVISVGSLAFKRFLEIAKKLNKNVVVVTDNDGDTDKLKSKYQEFEDCDNIRVCYSDNISLNTMELQISDCNEIEVLANVLGTKHQDKAALEKYMLDNKTKTALSIFEKGDKVVMPQYIKDAIQK
jgi:putative ATP-dependent endonuclease of OLD family